MNRADELVAQLGKQLGLGPIGFDKDGCCTLIFDGLPIEMDVADAQTIACSAVLAELQPEDVTRDLLEAMLRGNFFQLGTAGATLGFDHQSRIVSLVEKQRIGEMLAIEFQEWIERFVDTACGWKQRIGDIISGQTEPLADGPADFAFRV